MNAKFSVAIHGGAGRLSRRKRENPTRMKFEFAMKESLRAAQEVLAKGGTAVSAVVVAVTVLEDCPLFNAGRGAALCADGTVELSASLMCGRTLNVGAMARVQRVKNPIVASETLLNHHHGLLSGIQADAFAIAQGVEEVSSDYFVTLERLQQWENRKSSMDASRDANDDDGTHGTVGAVARDGRGDLAAATSTGGLVHQLPGRIGDTPVSGAGTWAQNQTCAVSATGKGDFFLRLGFARRVADLTELTDLSAGKAAVRALGEIENLGGQGGCIVIDSSGAIAMPFNSPQMLRGYCLDSNAPVIGMMPEDI